MPALNSFHPYYSISPYTYRLIACPADSALGKTITVDFTEGENSEFTAESGTTITYGTNGAEFIMTSEGLASTIVSSNYIFFGKVEVVMRAANGTGVISSFVMESDDLDEIDWVSGFMDIHEKAILTHIIGMAWWKLHCR